MSSSTLLLDGLALDSAQLERIDIDVQRAQYDVRG